MSQSDESGFWEITYWAQALLPDLHGQRILDELDPPHKHRWLGWGRESLHRTCPTQDQIDEFVKVVEDNGYAVTNIQLVWVELPE